LVAKVTAASEASRAAGVATRTYATEVGFYRDLGGSLPVRTPECYWAAYDEATAAYCVLLEDVAPATQGDQIAGCSLEEAAAALDELALLHAPTWGAAEADALDWLVVGGRDRGGVLGPFLEALLPGFFERYRDRLAPEVAALIERFVPALARYGSDWRGPLAVLHGDFRVDNLMFGLDRVVVLDWQTVSLGAPLSDVSYFLGGSLLPHDRRAAERDLVGHYLDRLVAAGDGKVDLSWDECWDDYRRFAFAGLMMAMFASMVVTRTDRGDDMFVAMADRAGLHALDLEAESFLVGG
jgi:hypothetical protein